MPGTPRLAEEKDRLEARARAMREEGASMAEVERETGVPASTLYQWAARGGWRASDIARRRMEAVMGENADASDVDAPGPQGPQGRPAAGPDGPPDRADAREDREKSASDHRAEPPAIPLSAEDLSSEAARCARAAMALSRAGRIKEAGEALKLAERYRDMAGEGGAQAGLSATEQVIYGSKRLAYAPHFVMAHRILIKIDERRARRGDKLFLEEDSGYGPWATPEEIAAFKAAAIAKGPDRDELEEGEPGE